MADGAIQIEVGKHEFDEDACCIHCGFDGAEWHWWRHSTYEGRAMKSPMPPCRDPKTGCLRCEEKLWRGKR